METTKYKVVAVNDEESYCTCCGKQGLKRVVWLVRLDLDGNECGEPVNYGTNCAGKFLGFSNMTKAKLDRRVCELAQKSKEERDAAFELESNLWRRISSDRGYANRMFWAVHPASAVAIEDTYFMYNGLDVCRVYKNSARSIEVLKKLGFTTK